MLKTNEDKDKPAFIDGHHHHHHFP